MKAINSFGGAVKISYFVEKVNYDLNYVYVVRFLLWVGLSCVLYCGFVDMVKLHKIVEKGGYLCKVYMLIISAIRWGFG